jgi:hypothetical protein
MIKKGKQQMKIVINDGYGGFGLSPKATQRYLELKGQKTYFYQCTYNLHNTTFERIDNIDDITSLFFYCTTRDQGKLISDYPKDAFHSGDIKRNDPALIQVVEELGDEASGECATLKIVEIENGRWFKIDEYDGWESIQYRDIDDEWILAE